MSLLRTSVFNPLRTSALPIMRSSMAVRGFADKPDPEFSEAYRRGTSTGFNKREQANEDQFVRQQEQEKLKALREKLEKHRKDLDDVESAIADLNKSSKK